MIFEKFKSHLFYFTKKELMLWFTSSVLIVVSFLAFDRENILILIASLIGVTSLIYNAKGNPVGQFLMIIFSALYGFISFTFAYYGEMITYLGMTAPMAVFALISWLKNPYNGNKKEVKVNRLKPKEIAFMIILAAAVTFIFYYILLFFHTANLVPSAVSVTTSSCGLSDLQKKRVLCAAYAANDIVLIILWILAALTDISYLSVVICFIMFFVNDIYGFVNWSKMRKRQEADPNKILN